VDMIHAGTCNRAELIESGTETSIGKDDVETGG
jgi:hypothetical protein